MSLIDWAKGKLYPQQRESAQPLPDFRRDQLKGIDDAFQANGIERVFTEAYNGEENRMTAGLAFYGSLWEDILGRFFNNGNSFYDNFTQFAAFCTDNGWQDDVHGSKKVLAKLAAYATLVLSKSPPVPPAPKGLVEQVMDTVNAVVASASDVLRTFGIDPQEIRDYLLGLLKLLI